jgi:hypothetical protein
MVRLWFDIHTLTGVIPVLISESKNETTVKKMVFHFRSKLVPNEIHSRTPTPEHIQKRLDLTRASSALRTAIRPPFVTVPTTAVGHIKPHNYKITVLTCRMSLHMYASVITLQYFRNLTIPDAVSVLISIVIHFTTPSVTLQCPVMIC